MCLDKMLNDLKKQYIISEFVFNKIKAGTHSPQQYYSLIMLNELLLLCKNCILIFNQDFLNISGIPPLIRIMHEIRIELQRLCKDSNYLSNILFYAFKEDKKTLESALKISTDQREKLNLENNLRTVQDNIKHIDKSKLDKLREKLKQAEEIDKDSDRLYAIFRKLSSHIHPNILTMKRKYVNGTLDPKYQDYDYHIYINYLSQILSDALNNMQKINNNVDQKLLKNINDISVSVNNEFRQFEKSKLQIEN